MAVFTPLNHQELEDLLSSFNLGPLLSFEPIEQGTVNSNYKLSTQQGSFVLTLLEAIDKVLASKLLDYMDYLSTQSLPVVTPIKNKHQSFLETYQDKGVTVCAFLPGQGVEKTNTELCYQVGAFLGRLHTLKDYPASIENQMGDTWRTSAIDQLMPYKEPDEKSLLEQLKSLQEEIINASLPCGMGHYDLFRDNVLIQNNQITGVLDFYYACDEVYIIDLSITLNDWCTHWDDGVRFDETLAQSLLKGYQSVRILEPLEWSFLPKAMSLMAGHYWLSRSLTKQAQKQGIGHFEKDPAPFKALMQNHLSGWDEEKIENRLKNTQL